MIFQCIFLRKTKTAIISQVKNLSCCSQSLNISRFYVEFPDPKSEQPQIEEISLKDIVNFEDGIRNPVREGDRVLASIGGSRKGKFVAGTVIEGEDMRNSFDCQNGRPLREVTLQNLQKKKHFFMSTLLIIRAFPITIKTLFLTKFSAL